MAKTHITILGAYTQDQLQDVGWYALRHAMRSVPLAKQQWVTKHMSGHFAHGEIWSSGKSIAQHVPDAEQLLKINSTCTQDDAALKWTKAIVALMQWMKDEQSDPNLIQALTQVLQAWRSGTALSEHTPAFHKQSQLGWDAALDGWLLVEWQVQQDAYWST